MRRKPATEPRNAKGTAVEGLIKEATDTATPVDRTMTKSEGRSEEEKTGRMPDDAGTPHATHANAPTKRSGRSSLTDHRSFAPDAQTGPITAGSSNRITGQTAREETRARKRIRNVMAYRLRLMAMTESCSATLTAAVERSSICKAKYRRWNFSLSFRCCMSWKTVRLMDCASLTASFS